MSGVPQSFSEKAGKESEKLETWSLFCGLVGDFFAIYTHLK